MYIKKKKKHSSLEISPDVMDGKESVCHWFRGLG